MTKRPWTAEDSVSLREFLTKAPHFLDHVREGKPSQLDGERATMENVALQAKLRDGVDLAIDRIEELSDPGKDPEAGAEFINPSQD